MDPATIIVESKRPRERFSSVCGDAVVDEGIRSIDCTRIGARHPLRGHFLGINSYTEIVADGSPGWTIQVVFYSADREEAPHVHVERDLAGAKFWLDPVRYENSRRFGPAELR